jgi:hypothetical protein
MKYQILQFGEHSPKTNSFFSLVRTIPAPCTRQAHPIYLPRIASHPKKSLPCRPLLRTRGSPPRGLHALASSSSPPGAIPNYLPRSEEGEEEVTTTAAMARRW